MSHNHPWTAQEERKLIQMRKLKYQAVDIARILGRTKQAVDNKVYLMKSQMKIVSPKSPEAETRSCLKCKDNFLSYGVGNRLCSKCHQSNIDKHDIQYAIGI